MTCESANLLRILSLERDPPIGRAEEEQLRREPEWGGKTRIGTMLAQLDDSKDDEARKVLLGIREAM